MEKVKISPFYIYTRIEKERTLVSQMCALSSHQLFTQRTVYCGQQTNINLIKKPV